MLKKSITNRLTQAGIETFIAALGLSGIVLMCVLLSSANDQLALTWMVGSFGASITLILACPQSQMAKPYPALVGNAVSAVIGVAIQQCLPDQDPALKATLAVSISVGAMCLLNALHPPGGATALLAVIGSPMIQQLGWLYPLYPITTGTLWLLALRSIRNKIQARYV